MWRVRVRLCIFLYVNHLWVLRYPLSRYVRAGCFSLIQFIPRFSCISRDAVIIVRTNHRVIVSHILRLLHMDILRLRIVVHCLSVILSKQIQIYRLRLLAMVIFHLGLSEFPMLD